MKNLGEDVPYAIVGIKSIQEIAFGALTKEDAAWQNHFNGLMLKYKESKNDDMLMRVLDKAIQKLPRDYRFRMEKVELLVKQNKFDRAFSIIKKLDQEGVSGGFYYQKQKAIALARVVHAKLRKGIDVAEIPMLKESLKKAKEIVRKTKFSELTGIIKSMEEHLRSAS